MVDGGEIDLLRGISMRRPVEQRQSARKTAHDEARRCSGVGDRSVDEDAALIPPQRLRPRGFGRGRFIVRPGGGRSDCEQKEDGEAPHMQRPAARRLDSFIAGDRPHRLRWRRGVASRRFDRAARFFHQM